MTRGSRDVTRSRMTDKEGQLEAELPSSAKENLELLSHLDLQINLLTEQKVTKVLELVDNDVREIKNIRGAPAEAPRARVEEMTKPADPHAILDAIKQKQS